MEVNANNAVQKLNRYTLLSLTYTRALYMFNNPKMECTKDKQLAVYPRRNSCKMSETVGRVVIGEQQTEGGANAPRWEKRMTFQEVRS